MEPQQSAVVKNEVVTEVGSALSGLVETVQVITLAVSSDRVSDEDGDTTREVRHE